MSVHTHTWAHDRSDLTAAQTRRVLPGPRVPAGCAEWLRTPRHTPGLAVPWGWDPLPAGSSVWEHKLLLWGRR